MSPLRFLAVLVLGALVVCAAADTADHAKGKGDEAQAKVAEGAAAAHESAQTWTEMAKEKLNIFSSDAQEKAGDTVDAAKDTAGSAKDKAADTVGTAKDKSAEGAAAAHETGHSYLDMAKEKLNEYIK